MSPSYVPVNRQWRCVRCSIAVSFQLLLIAAMAGFGASVAGCEVEERNFGDGGSGGAGASSPDSGGSCTLPSDCPAPADPCQISACVDGRCGAALLPEGTEIEPVA